MKTIQAAQSNSKVIQAKGTNSPEQQFSPYDLAGIRNRGSAVSAVDLAGWLRRVFRK